MSIMAKTMYEVPPVIPAQPAAKPKPPQSFRDAPVAGTGRPKGPAIKGSKKKK